MLSNRDKARRGLRALSVLRDFIAATWSKPKSVAIRQITEICADRMEFEITGQNEENTHIDNSIVKGGSALWGQCDLSRQQEREL